MRTVTAGMWLSVSEGCHLRCAMHGSNEAYVTVGESGIEHELNFDYISFKEFVAQSTAVLAEMDAQADKEQTQEDAEHLSVEP